ncbi:MAG TPA: signal peptidase I [Gaiellaceae bacterium]|nr:signal peptidase I [Gaiellaceae bacterium]
MPTRLVAFVLVTIGVFAAAFFGLTRRYTAPNTSMEPTVQHGDEVAVFRFSDWLSAPHRKDIVVYTAPPSASKACAGKQIGRVIGLPGETVSEQTGAVLIDGKPLTETYVKPTRRDTLTAAWHVPPGDYFVMGDNRTTQCDSRKLGAIPKKDIVGRVVFTYWPFDRISVG